MTIPLVNAAIAPSGALPAHPSPSAKLMNITQISVVSGGHISHTISILSSLVQIYTTGEVLFYTDDEGQEFTPDFGMPLSAASYFSYSVAAGSTLHFSADKSANIYILEG